MLAPQLLQLLSLAHSLNVPTVPQPPDAALLTKTAYGLVRGSVVPVGRPPVVAVPAPQVMPGGRTLRSMSMHASAPMERRERSMAHDALTAAKSVSVMQHVLRTSEMGANVRVTVPVVAATVPRLHTN